MFSHGLRRVPRLREIQKVSESRPHRALGEKTPNESAKEIAGSRDFFGLQTAEKLALDLV